MKSRIFGILFRIYILSRKLDDSDKNHGLQLASYGNLKIIRHKKFMPHIFCIFCDVFQFILGPIMIPFTITKMFKMENSLLIFLTKNHLTTAYTTT